MLFQKATLIVVLLLVPGMIIARDGRRSRLSPPEDTALGEDPGSVEIKGDEHEIKAENLAPGKK